MQRVKSLNVLQKARSEELAKNDLDGDDAVDILRRMRKAPKGNHPYIRAFHTPFTIFLCCQGQIDFIFSLVLRGAKFVLNWDDTGSVIRKPSRESSKILLSSGVVNYEKNY